MNARKKAKKMKKVDYRYTECGLDNVIIEDVEVTFDDEGEAVYCIPRINQLHRTIARSILTQERGISPKEMRFVRTELGLTQEELAEILKLTRATVNRWENDRERIDPTAEFLFRMIAAYRLDIDISMTPEELAKNCVWRAEVVQIKISIDDLAA